jgi:DNA topoisomerase-2
MDIEKKYVKLTPIEHIKKRPDTYIGSIKTQAIESWVLSPDKKSMIRKNLLYAPGMFKIIDEIITNAGDRLTEDPLCNTVKINYSLNEECTSMQMHVFNNGDGIPVVEHPKWGVYIPTLLFGNLLSSSNFDDNKKRKAGGRNGLGAKACNIFSEKFVVETVDMGTGLKFTQTWKNNMAVATPPRVKKVSEKVKTKPYTKISFVIDLALFGLTQVNRDILDVVDKRVFDLAATVGGGKNVYLNGKKVTVNNFKKYIGLFTPPDSKTVYECTGSDWTVGVSYKQDQGYAQVSFVNGVSTSNGGNHVRYVENQVVDRLCDYLGNKAKTKVKPAYVKEHLHFFVNSMITNPTFTSQTKEELKTPEKEFRDTCALSDSFFKKIENIGITKYILQFLKFKQDAMLTKIDGKKSKRVAGIDKLTDASWAGTVKSGQCILVLTEGDSAKGLAMAGRRQYGNNRMGVFPLKGKLLNIRDVSVKKVSENEEIKNIMKILGLKYNHSYTGLDALRYGKVMLFTDSDVDGIHIKGLLLNFISYYWPSLIYLGFITFLPTHLVRATRRSSVIDFMTMQDYYKWKKQKGASISGWHIKYYKGLGTSTRKDAIEYFTALDNKLITYVWNGDDEGRGCKESMKMAFDKTCSGKRKEWLDVNADADADTSSASVNYRSKQICISDFVNKELKLFSVDDNKRSIPSKNDGLKPSLRKIIFSMFKKKCFSRTNELKVSQLSGYTSEQTSYHHGEASLQKAIIGMAQDYVGKNNINLLFPNGQFGTRLENGKDAASARYIFTYLSSITPYIFRSEDSPVLKYLEEDGKTIEPEQYYPIVPMVLINGADGIGTGWSCEVPSYNLLDVIVQLKNIMASNPVEEMKPWYRGFKGTVEASSTSSCQWVVRGRYSFKTATTMEITELPIGTSIQKYKVFLDSLIASKSKKSSSATDMGVKSYDNNSSDNHVHFVLHFSKTGLDSIKKQDVYKKLKLRSTVKTSNMHLLDDNGYVRKYERVADILESFYTSRVDKYKERKVFWTDKYRNDLSVLENKLRYIKYNMEGKIRVFGMKKTDIIDTIIRAGFPKLSTQYPSLEKDLSFDYITKLYHFDFTLEKIEELENMIAEKKAQLKEVADMTSVQWWERDLHELEKAYSKFMN